MTITTLPNVKFTVNESRDIFQLKQRVLQKNSSSHKLQDIGYDFFSGGIFPVGCARLIIQAVKKIAPAFILPACITYDLELKKKAYELSPTPKQKAEIETIQALDQEREKFIFTTSNCAEQITVKTADQADLDLLAIRNSAQQTLPPQAQKWILYLHGNNTCYENHLDQLKLLSERTGANVLTGNYRGVMRSKGIATASEHLVIDGEAMVQYLLHQGVPANHIFMHGYSLGGAVGTEVAANHQEKGCEMHLCNERSFSTITDFLKAQIFSIFASLLGELTYDSGWMFDSVKQFQKIKGNKFIIHSKEDGVIRYEASLYKRLKEAQMTPTDRKLKAERQALKKQGLKIEKHPKEYKPKNSLQLRVNITEDDKPLSRNEIIKKHGTKVHCYSLSEVEDLFALYVKQVKATLNII
jgi:pimeloyl-ACP methyl ester carboxylesterase